MYLYITINIIAVRFEFMKVCRDGKKCELFFIKFVDKHKYAM